MSNSLEPLYLRLYIYCGLIVQRGHLRNQSVEIQPWLPGYLLSRTYEAQTTDFRISWKWHRNRPPNGIYSGTFPGPRNTKVENWQSDSYLHDCRLSPSEGKCSKFKFAKCRHRTYVSVV